MFIGHLIRVVAELVEAIAGSSGFMPFCGADILITDINPRIKLGKVDIDPPGIFRYSIKITAIAHYPGIDGIFKGIRKARFLENLVLVGRKIYLEIAPSLGGEDPIAG
jgi:hypothetical protein